MVEGEAPGNLLDHNGRGWCLGDSLPLDVGSVRRMVFFSDDARVLVSLASGLIGGAGVGVLTAGVIAVNGAKAQQLVPEGYRRIVIRKHIG